MTARRYAGDARYTLGSPARDLPGRTGARSCVSSDVRDARGRPGLAAWDTGPLRGGYGGMPAPHARQRQYRPGAGAA